MKLLRKEVLLESFDRYDLEVADNHNFFVSGVAVHNCSLKLVYVKGKLVSAASRGNGEVGQDLTDNVMAMKSVPKTLPNPVSCEVRCECFMRKSVFKRLGDEMSKRGEKPFANPRNAASGSLMSQDPKETGSRDLSIACFDVVDAGVVWQTEQEKREWIEENLKGIEVVQMQDIDISDFSKFATEWEVKRPTLDFEIDGLVVALSSLEDQEDAGWNGRRPRGKMAFKFPPEQAQAKVLDIDLQIGRTGRATPMARIERTLLAGSHIENITLHNVRNVVKILGGVALGDVVLIQKAGDIIPQVVKVVDRPASRKEVDFPSMRCPSCGGPLEMDEKEVSLWCMNPACPAKLQGRILHYLKTLEVLGVGEGIVAKLCEYRYVKDLPDLYFVSESQMRRVTGGDSSAIKAVEAILSKNEIPLAMFLDSLGISGLGTTSSKDVAKEFKTLDSVMFASEYQFRKIAGIGDKTAKNIAAGMISLRPTIERLIQCIEVKPVLVSSGPLNGKSFVLTGAMSKPRKIIEKAIEAAGGECRSSVSRGVTYLVQSDPTSTSNKTQAAAKCGTAVISEVALWKMMEE